VWYVFIAVAFAAIFTVVVALGAAVAVQPMP
jgi:hypothetical protein